jgi:predicted transcriptional regulator of viral defense system
MANPRTKTQRDRSLALLRRKGVARSRDLADLGVARTTLQRLESEGALERVSRGLYRLADANVTEFHDLAAAAARVPRGVICLLSALRFHDLGTQNPREVWVALAPGDRRPVVESPPLRVVRFSGVALTRGVGTHRIEGIDVRVTSKAKTVADCFKYRNKTGLDVAIEALRDYRRGRGSLDELWRMAEVCRVARVMRPYIEAGV